MQIKSLIRVLGCRIVSRAGCTTCTVLVLLKDVSRLQKICVIPYVLVDQIVNKGNQSVFKTFTHTHFVRMLKFQGALNINNN